MSLTLNLKNNSDYIQQWIDSTNTYCPFMPDMLFLCNTELRCCPKPENTSPGLPFTKYSDNKEKIFHEFEGWATVMVFFQASLASWHLQLSKIAVNSSFYKE